MNKWRTVSLLLILVAGAYLLASDHPESEAPGHDVSIIHHSIHAHVAMTDMLHHAAAHLDHATPHDHTFGYAPGWADGWQLHWMDFHSEGHVVRVYHVTHERHPHVRFVTVADPHHGRSGAWSRVQ